MSDEVVWYIIIGVSVTGGLAVMGVFELVVAIWAGRRRFDRRASRSSERRSR